MARLPGNWYRASTYAAIEPSSMVSTTPPVTTITVLKNRSPMWPVVHALEKFSQCSPVGTGQRVAEISRRS